MWRHIMLCSSKICHLNLRNISLEGHLAEGIGVEVDLVIGKVDKVLSFDKENNKGNS